MGWKSRENIPSEDEIFSIYPKNKGKFFFGVCGGAAHTKKTVLS
jgi:hypothetical protein